MSLETQARRYVARRRLSLAAQLGAHYYAERQSDLAILQGDTAEQADRDRIALASVPLKVVR